MSEEELQLSLSAVIKSASVSEIFEILIKYSEINLYVLMAVVWVCLLLVSVHVCDVMRANMLLSHSGVTILFQERSGAKKYHEIAF